MYGAALLYNLMLTESLPPSDDLEERLQQRRAAITEWCTELAARADGIQNWDHGGFWQLAKGSANVRASTERFVEDWWKLTPWRDPQLAMSSPEARELIRAREAALKRSRARLGNQRAIELWNGAAGLSRLSYRWAVTTRMVNDIHAGLGLGGGDARAA